MSYEAERQNIEQHFVNNVGSINGTWSTAKGGNIGFDARTFKPVKNGESIRITIGTGASFNASLGKPGSNLKRTAGVIFFQIFVPGGEGSNRVRQIADDITSVFENAVIGNITTRTAAAPVPQDEPSFLSWTVGIPYQRDDFTA